MLRTESWDTVSWWIKGRQHQSLSILGPYQFQALSLHPVLRTLLSSSPYHCQGYTSWHLLTDRHWDAKITGFFYSKTWPFFYICFNLFMRHLVTRSSSSFHSSLKASSSPKFSMTQLSPTHIHTQILFSTKILIINNAETPYSHQKLLLYANTYVINSYSSSKSVYF